MYKPILVPTDNKHSGLDIDPQNGDKLSKESTQYYHKNPQIIILIDTEAEIVEGNLCINKNLDTIYSPNCLGDTSGWIKIISSTNKSHNLPQLSPQSIQLLINYYNEYKCMPESVEVETEAIGDNPIHILTTVHEKSYEKWGIKYIKLNQQGEVDITIPKVEEKLYTESEVEELIYNATKEVPNEDFDTVKDWFNSKKK